jgi:ASC-1-like (ASCH) protein
MEHDLKCWPHEFDAVKRGDKTFEVRRNDDRDFAEGDVLLLRKWDPAREDYVIGDSDGYTQVARYANTLRAVVTYILHGGRFGLPLGLCVMAIRVEPNGG